MVHGEVTQYIYIYIYICKMNVFFLCNSLIINRTKLKYTILGAVP